MMQSWGIFLEVDELTSKQVDCLGGKGILLRKCAKSAKECGNFYTEHDENDAENGGYLGFQLNLNCEKNENCERMRK